MSRWQGKFVLKIIVGWADSFIVCPRGLVAAWAQKRAHPTLIDFKHNYLKNKLALVEVVVHLAARVHFCLDDGVHYSRGYSHCVSPVTRSLMHSLMLVGDMRGLSYYTIVKYV